MPVLAEDLKLGALEQSPASSLDRQFDVEPFLRADGPSALAGGKPPAEAAERVDSVHESSHWWEP